MTFLEHRPELARSPYQGLIRGTAARSYLSDLSGSMIAGSMIALMPDSTRIRVRERLHFASIFMAICFIGCCIHEFGHAVFGWVQGIPVLLTPAKEYILQAEVDWNQRARISLGGVVATALLAVGVLLWYALTRRQDADAVLAGVLEVPFAYTLRFALAGRGHDGMEWQGAQSAVGASPSGHLVDIVFLCIVAAGLVVWGFRRRRSIGPALLLKAAGLAVAGVIFLVFLQVGNNAVFDRYFSRTAVVNIPAGVVPE